MANKGNILVMNGAKVKLPQVLIPNRGSLFVDCNRCACRTFAVRVEPLPKEGCARVKELVCTECRKTFRVDDQAKLEGKETHHKDGSIYGNRKGRGTHQHTAERD